MRGLPVAVCPHHPGGPPEGPIPGPALAPAGVPDPTRTGGAVPLPAGAPTTEFAPGPHRPGLPAQRDCFGGRTTWDSLAAIADLGEAEEYLRLFHTECPHAAGRLAPRLA